MNVLEITSDTFEDEVYLVSFVTKPAIEEDYIALSEESEQQKIIVLSEEKRIVTGAVLVPDKRIYRNDANGEYYIWFSKETISNLRDKFHLRKKTDQTNIQHKGSTINANYVIESYITSETLSDSRFNYPIGTWVMTYKVEDDNTWNLIKEGSLKGFSIEAVCKSKPTKMNKIETLMAAFKSYFTDEKVELAVAPPIVGEVPVETPEAPVEEVEPTEDPMEDVVEESKLNSIMEELAKLTNLVNEIQTKCDIIVAENKMLTEELSKQKDYSALNLSRISTESTKPSSFNSTLNYLK